MKGALSPGCSSRTTSRKTSVWKSLLAYQSRLFESMEDAVVATDEHFVVTTWNKGAEAIYGWTADEVVGLGAREVFRLDMTAWNKGAETMFGWKAEEALGRAVYECIPTVYSDEQLAYALQEVSQTGQRFTEGRLWRHKDGSLVCAEARTFAIRGDDGEIAGYTSVMRDIAERVRAQDEIEERARQQAAVAQFGLQALTGGGPTGTLDRRGAMSGTTFLRDPQGEDHRGPIVRTPRK